ncbi:hypothetical protein AVEN_81254-1 [Araneus ventricosus]|uniref:Uncharacterized protein n=1 Tax=Araneus ventricosus TaxID=182803 RepID=A0A4Y2HSB1_ARAVE|nr:hypothetical protein AVEN_81254-1 [Araneus ventricosus]
MSGRIRWSGRCQQHDPFSEPLQLGLWQSIGALRLRNRLTHVVGDFVELPILVRPNTPANHDERRNGQHRLFSKVLWQQSLTSIGGELPYRFSLPKKSYLLLFFFPAKNLCLQSLSQKKSLAFHHAPDILNHPGRIAKPRQTARFFKTGKGTVIIKTFLAKEANLAKSNLSG